MQLRVDKFQTWNPNYTDLLEISNKNIGIIIRYIYEI